ncbi:methionine gamma-lyase [Pseudomonas sp. K1(2024)]|uniref:L-methionine gamma-lyase n=1 Tax=Pseudomonas boreofloridensis TaxID=3064348 RepID=A0ABV4Z757_9PSED|nr:methionine gamma-lyase [Pseudomonas sp. K13]MDO7903094.1 methionine gamma-lyase [Pseudomonas sp. K13]
MRAASHKPGFSTRAIHLGYDPQSHGGALVPPVYQTATYAFASVEYGAACFAGELAGHVYSRISNPTLALLEQRMASLEGAEAGLALASGMGAITSTLWTLLRPGDELIVGETLYGCTFAFLHHGIGEFGVKIRHVDLNDLAALEAAITPQTRMIYFETPANPNMHLVDIPAVVGVARRHELLVTVDNTYCTPYLQRPLELGADLVVHSATKYLSGHGDLTAGMVLGRRALIERIRLQGLKDMTGAVLSAQDAALLMRGLKTLALRMERHCSNALRVAQFLERQAQIEVIRYPGLSSFPQFGLAQRQMRLPGGMIAFELKGGQQAGRRFMNALQVFSRAVSLGDAESLAQHPASMTHSSYTAQERAEHGISEGLVRLSVGLEDIEDLLADLGQALRASV